MKLRYIWGVSFILALVLGSYYAVPVTADSPDDGGLQIIRSNAQEIELELTVGEYRIESLSQNGEIYQRFVIDGMSQTDVPGDPQVPVRSTMLGVASTSNVSVQILEADYDTLNNFRLYPAPGLSVPEGDTIEQIGGDVQEVFTLNQTRYATNAFFPDQPVEIGQVGYMRDQAAAQVKFYAVQYNPVSSEVRLYRRLRVRVSWDSPPIGASSTRGASAAYENFLEQSLINYDTLERPPVVKSSPSEGATGGNIGAASSHPQVKIGVEEDGLYKVTPADLPAELTGVSTGTLKIKNKGAEIPIYVHDDDGNGLFDNNNDYILFYGTAITDIYTTKNIYWLEATGSGQRMAQRDAPGGGTPPTDFPVTLHLEEDTYYWQTMPNGSGQDHWFWRGRLTAPDVSDPYTFELANILTPTAKMATVRVQFKGGTSISDANPDHHTKIFLNGTQIDSQQWDGLAVFEHEVDIAHNLLIDGTNVITVETPKLVDPPPYKPEQVFLNWIEIEYYDTYVAEDNQLLFSAPSAGAHKFQVTNFSASEVMVFDITDPANVQQVINGNLAGGQLTFQDTAQTDTKYLAIAPTEAKTPASIELDQPSNLINPNPNTGMDNNGADYIIITHEDFYNNAKLDELISHRSALGQVVKVDVEDIYDEFNHGIFNPQAIKDFLAYAYQEWDPPPTYVLLVGDSTLDYRDILAPSKPIFVPSLIVETIDLGQTPSDNGYVAVSGTDDLVDMFLGRLTAESNADVNEMVNKIISYENSPPSDDSWNSKALFVADDDSSDVFENYSNELISTYVPGNYIANTVYLPPGQGDPEPKDSILDYINGGRILVNYAGHGNVNWWAEEKILTTSDISSLSNGSKLPVVAVANCLNGYFTSKWTPSIAEKFLEVQGKGAVAIWAPTGLGYPSGHRALLSAFYEAIFWDNIQSLGAATTAAKNNTPTQQELLDTFVLFGDPAMQIGLPANHPYVESITPANGATDVPLEQSIQITFSKPMDDSTVVLSGPDAGNFNVSWNADYTQVTYSHKAGESFAINETLVFTITGQDNGQNPLSLVDEDVPSTWSFTTLDPDLDDVTITGATTGITDTTYTFTASVSPVTAGLPITYTWEATGKTPQLRVKTTITDTINFSWNVTGAKTITVTASNAYSSVVSDVHTITINGASQGAGSGTVYIPIVIKNE